MQNVESVIDRISKNMKVIYLGIPQQRRKSAWKKLRGKISIGSKVNVEKILDELEMYRAEKNF